MTSQNRLEDLQLLLVDDEKQMSRLLSDVLGNLGFKDFTIANDGQAAIDFVKERTFDFIVTDWRMPNVEGIELVRFVRFNARCRCPHVPIIMLSGNTELRYICEARDAGVNEYVIKPFSASQLVRRIKSIIERPRCFVETMTYHGPNRRWHNTPIRYTDDRRKMPDIGKKKELRQA